MQTKKNIRALASEIIHDVIFKKQSLDQALALHLKKNIDPRDAALLQEMCYGSLRWYHRINKIVAELLEKPLQPSENIVYALLIIGIYQLLYLRIPEYAAISETVNAIRELDKPYAAPLINGVLRNFLRNKDNILQTLENTQYSHPAWFIKALQKSWPEYWQEILIANNARPPMSIRININKISREKYLQLLTEQNIAAHLDNHTKTGVTLEKPVDVNNLPNFKEGFIYIQDTASQLAAELLEIAPNQRILDACAAPGGKLTHILESESNLQEIVALELDAKRMEKIQENLARLGLEKNVKLICGDASNPTEWWDGKKFDRILLDAPCSATGVIRRHPDIKILRTKDDIAALQKQQLQILESLWSLLKVNGMLLYATCSIFSEENANVVEQFLDKNKNAQEKLITENWGVPTKFGRQIITGRENMDGFYYAKLIKIAD